MLRNEDRRLITPRNVAPPYKVYSIRIEAEYSYEIIQRSKVLDSHLQLVDEDGNIVSESGTDFGKGDARIRVTLRDSGNYYIRATTLNEQFGAFELSIQRAKTP